MPWSGGNFTRTDGTRTGSTVWTAAKAAAVKIIATDHDTHDQDLSDGIDACWNRDGSNAATASMPMGTNKFTGLGAGSTAGDSVRYEQVAHLAVAPVFTVDVTLLDTNADANAGPELILDRNLASGEAAANDLIGKITWRGADNLGAVVDYAEMTTKIIDETAGTEDGEHVLSTMQGGSMIDAWRIGLGIYYEGGADPGAGDIATTDLYVAGNMIHIGDVNNFIGFPAADTFRITTGGAERADFTDSGLQLGNTGARVTEIEDSDTLGTSDTKLATQGNVKAYVDAGTGVVGLQNTWISAGAMVSMATAGAASGLTETGAADIMVRTFDFDTGSDEFVQFEWRLPKRWAPGTAVTFIPHWTAASGSGTVLWGIAGVGFKDSDAIGATAFGSYALCAADTLLTALDEHIAAASAACTIASSGTLAKGDRVTFKVQRDVSGDTLGVDAKLIGLQLIWTSDAVNDA